MSIIGSFGNDTLVLFRCNAGSCTVYNKTNDDLKKSLEDAEICSQTQGDHQNPGLLPRNYKLSFILDFTSCLVYTVWAKDADLATTQDQLGELFQG